VKSDADVKRWYRRRAEAKVEVKKEGGGGEIFYDLNELWKHPTALFSALS
jgi:hypothetical protein